MKIVKKNIGYLNKDFWRVGWYRMSFGQRVIQLPGYLIFWWIEEKDGKGIKLDAIAKTNEVRRCVV